ncbi:MAG: hypothetical protein QXW53_02715 [Desulfurococcaceae archaeon]
MIIEQLVQALTDVALKIIAAIPAVILALIVILIGYLIGSAVRSGIRLLFDRAVWRFLRKTVVGQKFEEYGISIGDVLGAVVMAIIVALSILLAINMLGFLGPAVNIITSFINLVIGILGGVVILIVGIPLATLAGEYLARLIGLAIGEREKEGFVTTLQTVLTILFVLFVLGLAVAVMFGASELLAGLTAVLPSAFTAGVVIIVGYIVGDLVSRMVKVVIERLAKPLEATDIGAAIKATGLDAPGLIAGLVKALIVVIAITVGLGMIAVTGIAAEILEAVTFYLPRIFGALVILILGLPLVLILSKYIGKVFKAVVKEKYAVLGDLVENLVAIGLVAVFITIALNVVVLPGNYVYSFIIGAVIIALGVIVVDTVVSLLKETSPLFARFLPLLGAVFVFIIVYVGLTTILSQIPGAIEVLRVVAYGIAGAVVLLIIPVLFYLVRVALKEAAEVKTS